MVFLETKGLDDEDEDEQQADKFAKDLLIPPAYATALTTLDKTYVAIERFAQKIGIALAVVVGRMQNEGYLSWGLLNKCKVGYKWNHASSSQFGFAHNDIYWFCNNKGISKLIAYAFASLDFLFHLRKGIVSVK